MNLQSNPIIHTGLAMALGLFLWSPVQVLGAEDTAGEQAKSMKMPACCHEIAMRREKMGEACKAQDTEISELLTRMNSAPEDKKVGMMAAVITLLVEQRKARDARREEMEGGMMEHAMCHGAEGGMPGCHTARGWIGMHDGIEDSDHCRKDR